MKIRHLKIEGFRSLRQVEWTPGDLNVIIGPNGSGKSNLLWALELLSESASGRLDEFILRRGGMAPLVWDGTAGSLLFHLNVEFPLAEEGADGATWTYQLELARLSKTSSYRIVSEVLADRSKVRQGERTGPPKAIERTEEKSLLWSDERHEMIELDDVPRTETIVSFSYGPFTVNRTVSQFREHLSSWRMYQDFRTDRDAPVRQAPISRSELYVSPNGGDLVSALHTLYSTSREFEENINSGMSVAFGQDYDRLVFPPDADGRVQLRIRWKSLRQEQSAVQLSDGALRFLYLLTILSNPTLPDIIAIDEPETGLHPGMLDIVAEYAADAALRSQVILTTHSAELLDTLTRFRPVVTSANWEDGGTNLVTIRESELDYWTKHYTLGRLFRTGELEFIGVTI